MGQHAAVGRTIETDPGGLGGDVRRLIESGGLADVALSARQREVVDLLRGGASVGGIAGQLGLTPHTVQRHLNAIRERLLAPACAVAPRHGPTHRQVEVLRLLAGGATNREAAEALGVSQATVQTHLGALCDLFGVRTRRRLIGRAVALGLIPPPSGVVLRREDDRLSPEQRRLLLLLESGASNREVAAAFGITEAAAGSRVARLCARLSVGEGANVAEVRRQITRIPDGGKPPALTPRQTEILGLLRGGMTDLQIARHLGLGVERVKNCIKALRRRCADAVPARRRGRRAGGVAPDGAGRPRDLSDRRIAAAGLTPRQEEVIRLTREGRTAEAIAGALGIALVTVRMHRHYAYRALAQVGHETRS